MKAKSPTAQLLTNNYDGVSKFCKNWALLYKRNFVKVTWPQLRNTIYNSTINKNIFYNPLCPASISRDKNFTQRGTKSYASLRQLLLPRTISKRVRGEAILVKSSIKI